jgi:hypothetical protein
MALTQEDKMKTLLLVPAVLGLMVGSASAENAHFIGKWHWNRAQSTLAPNEPAPQDVNASIQSADAGHIKWTAEVVDHKGQKHAETFDGKPDGKFYPVAGAGAKVTASFTWINDTLQSVFKEPDGGSDTQTCALSADTKKMTCTGTWSDGKSNERYVDIYDRT